MVYGNLNCGCNSIHYFVFLVQHFMDPPKDLSEALKSKEIPETAFFTMKHGETRVIK